MTRNEGRPFVPAWVPLAAFFTLFVAGRLWYFVDFPIPVVHPDSGSYFALSEAFWGPALPRFGDRSPLYPFLLAVTFRLVDRLIALVYVQTALSCVAGLLMVYVVHRRLPAMSLPVAVALGAYFMDCDALEHDSAMLTESLYTSLLILSSACLIGAFGSARPSRWLAAASLLMALVIYARPGGLFLLVIYVLVLAYLSVRRAGAAATLAFGVPFAAALLVLATYNARTLGAFVLSMSDATEVSLITNLYWETDASYPPDINAAIEDVRRQTAERVSGDEMRILNESWQVPRLYDLYLRSHHYGPHTAIAKVTGGWGTPAWRGWLLRLSRDAIRKHPDRFLKHFVVMMLYYYRAVFYNVDFRQYLYNRVMLFWVDKQFSRQRGLPLMVRMGKEFADPERLPPAVTVVDFDRTHEMPANERIQFRETPLTRVYLWLQSWLRGPFTSLAWPAAQVFILALSLAMLIRTRLTHDGAFLLAILCLMVLGNAMVVSLVEYSQPRYSYPLEWAYYVAALCLPLLTSRRQRLLATPSQAA